MSKKLSEIYKIGDEVMVCNTHLSNVWVKCVVVGYHTKNSIIVDSETKKCYGGSWSVPEYIRKPTKLERALS